MRYINGIQDIIMLTFKEIIHTIIINLIFNKLFPIIKELLLVIKCFNYIIYIKIFIYLLFICVLFYFLNKLYTICKKRFFSKSIKLSKTKKISNKKIIRNKKKLFNKKIINKNKKILFNSSSESLLTSSIC